MLLSLCFPAVLIFGFILMAALSIHLIVSLADKDSYNGTIAKSPFIFQHNNNDSIYCNKDQVPCKPLQPDFENDQFICCYVLDLFTQTFQYYKDSVTSICRFESKNGNVLFAFDLTHQLDSSDMSFALLENGNIRLEIYFVVAVARTLTVVVIAKNDNLLENDNDQHVAFDYTA